MDEFSQSFQCYPYSGSAECRSLCNLQCKPSSSHMCPSTRSSKQPPPLSTLPNIEYVINDTEYSWKQLRPCNQLEISRFPMWGTTCGFPRAAVNPVIPTLPGILIHATYCTMSVQSRQLGVKSYPTALQAGFILWHNSIICYISTGDHIKQPRLPLLPGFILLLSVWTNSR